MSEPISPDDRAVGAPERLHPLFLLTGLGGSLRGFAGGYAAIAYLAVSGRATMAIFAAILLLLFLIVGLILYWTHFEYRVGQSEIRIDSGILSRTHRSIPFDRIQDVDITQGPLARLFGLAQVKFETGGSAGAGEDEGVIRAITLERAQAIRALVRSGRSAGPALDVAADEGRPPIYAMNFSRLLLAGTFNFSLAVFAGLFGLTQTFGDVLGFDPLSRRFWERLLSAGSPIADYVLQHRIAAVAAGSLFLLLLGLLTGVARTLLRDYGFRLDRTEVGLRRRRGLLTRTDVTLPVARAQAIILRTGPLRDTFGWSELMLQSLARDEGGRGDHVLAPLANSKEAAAIVGELGWRPLPAAIGWSRVSSAYFWTLAIAVSPLFLIALGQAAFSWALGTAYTAALLLVLAFRWLAWRRTGYALDGDRLLMRSGWWRRRLVVLPFAKIQSIDLTENFVGRWFGIASLHLGVAGGSGFGRHVIPAIPSAGARQLRADLLGSAL
jgi:putative membrane protein